MSTAREEDRKRITRRQMMAAATAGWILAGRAVPTAGLSSARLGVLGVRNVPPEFEKVIDRGLAFLAKQQKGNGQFAFLPGRGSGVQGGGRRPSASAKSGAVNGNADEARPIVPADPPAAVAAVLLAFLSAGHFPDLGKYGAVVRKAIDALPAEPGDIAQPAHAKALLLLAATQAAGADPEPESRDRLLQLAAAVVSDFVETQSAARPPGGWPTKERPAGDVYLTGWNLFAISAARATGVRVPARCLQRAQSFLNRSFDADLAAFIEQDPALRKAAKARDLAAKEAAERAEDATADDQDVDTDAEANASLDAPAAAAARATNAIAAFAVWHATGGASIPSASAIEQLPAQVQSPRAWGDTPQEHRYAVTLAAITSDTAWPALNENAAAPLVKTQDADGGWPGRSNDRIYSTAMAVLTLTAAWQVLPAYLPAAEM